MNTTGYRVTYALLAIALAAIIGGSIFLMEKATWSSTRSR